MTSRTVLLFSYGTLQDRRVQLEAFGRELSGRPDTLPGYTLLEPDESPYANVLSNAKPEGAVSGTVFTVTQEELEAADRYEEDAGYRRIRVMLQSGEQAWVYLRPVQ